MLDSISEITEICRNNPLSLEVRVDPLNYCEKPSTILVGNSGLKFSVYQNNDVSIEMHFVPDYCSSDDKKIFTDQQKYSLLFPAAFYEFYQWYLNDNNFDNEFPRPEIITGLTNLRMNKFLENLFNRQNTIYETVCNNNLFDCKLNLGKIKSDYILLNRLKKIHDFVESKKDNIKMR